MELHLEHELSLTPIKTNSYFHCFLHENKK